MIRLLIISILLNFTLTPLFAAPDVTSVGSLNNGDPVTIGGTDFGTKATAAPIRFEQFEVKDGGGLPTVGVDPASEISYWTLSGGQVEISDQHLRGVSQRGSEHYYAGGSIPGDGYAYLGAENMGLGQKYYVNFWVWFQWSDDLDQVIWDGGTGLQIKMLYIGASFSGADLERPALEPQWFWSSGPDDIQETADDYTYINMKHGDEDGPLTNLCKPPNDSVPYSLVNGNGAWYNISYEVDQGTADTADGTFKNTQSILDFASSYFSCNESGVKWRVSDLMDATQIGWLHVGPLADPVTNYYDDIYYDTGWSRVEIGDNEDYDSCAHREIQKPTRWDASGDRVDITANQGSFTEGVTYYLFVIEDGVPNETGYPVIFGDEEEQTMAATSIGASVN